MSRNSVVLPLELAAAAIAVLTIWTTPSMAQAGSEKARSYPLFAPKALGVSRVAPAGPSPVGGTNSRWAGYVVAGQTYSAMGGSWTVPITSYAQRAGNPGDEYSSAWIGIGGNADQDGTLVQLGTAQEASSSSGVGRYYAWYLFYGGLGHGETKLDPSQYPVSPGDKITASIRCAAACTPNAAGQVWTLTMSSSRWQHPFVLENFRYSSSMASAEWIMEATTVGGVIQQLPKFAPITFTGLSVNGAPPNLSFAENGLTIADGNHNALAIATPATDNSFTVKEIGIPPSQPLPTQPGHTVCTSGTDYGAMTTGVGANPAGNLQGVGAVDYYRFYLTQYSFITFFALPKPLKYSYQIVDDLSGAAHVPTSPGIAPQPELSLDPGYYCLKVFNPQGLGDVPYKISFSAQKAGVPPSQNRASPIPLSQFELGNLSQNGYFQDSRYVYYHNNPHPSSPPPLVLAAGHEYVLRDWVGPTLQDQWYEFSLDRNRNVALHLGNLYEGATVTIETKAGAQIVAAATYDNASSLNQLLPPQSLSVTLPSGDYLLHVSFSGVGASGTTYALSLTAQ